MFRPQTMSRVELIIPERDVTSVTEALIGSSLFHLSSTRYTEAQGNGRGTEEWQGQTTKFAALEQQIGNAMAASGVREVIPPSEPLQLIELGEAQNNVARLEQEVQRPVAELEEAQRDLGQLQRYLDELEPIADMGVNLDALRNTRYLHVILGTMPTANINRFQSSLERVPFVLVPLRRDERLTTVALFGRRSDADILARAARSAYLNPLSPPEGYHGTPNEVIAAVKKEISELHRHVAEGQQAIRRLRETRGPEMRALLWRVRASRTLTETIASYGRLHYTYLTAGWVPTAEVPSLEQQIRRVSDKVLIEVDTPRRQGGEAIPVSLKNPPLIRLFQGLVTMYGYPSYGEIDPTPMVALTFPLIFGLMFGDVGHGLLLLLLGLLLFSRKVPSLRGLAGIGGIAAACGIVSMVSGALYGSVFGFEDVIPSLWLRPIQSITDIMVVTVGMGTILLTAGMVQGVINAAMARQWGRLVFDRNGLTGLIFYWSLLGLVVGSFLQRAPVDPRLCAALAVLGGLAIMFSEPLKRLVAREHPLIHGSMGTYLIEAFVEIFETTISLFSNTLSYVRIGAFAVAHGELSTVVFLTAESVSPAHGVGYWIVVVLGNLFVFGFEGVLVSIQTLRLEYYEYFSKFFSGGGTRYRPLRFVPTDTEG